MTRQLGVRLSHAIEGAAIVEWNHPLADGFLPGQSSLQGHRGSHDHHPPMPATLESGQASVHYAVSKPANYTPGYAYPLILWFHDDRTDERDVLEWLPRISPQNYLGIGLRAPLPALDGLPGQMRWSTGPQHMQWAEDHLATALLETCQELSIHYDRIVTAGIGRGATMALQMMLRRPDLFAAAACLNAELPQDWRLDCWGQYIGRSVWLGHSEMLTDPIRQPAISAARTLHAAGMNVMPRSYSADEWPLNTFARELDAWLMNTLCGDTVIA